MSWGDVFFGFRGRINRKTFLFGSALIAIAGLLFSALLAYLATGDPLSPDIWELPADRSTVWIPVSLASFAFLAWPSAALAVKRLHDRGKPVWIWYIYYASYVIVSLIPLKSVAGDQAGPAPILLLPLAVFGAYMFIQLGVLRGTAGPNEHGEDTLPPGYHGGDHDFWSWMFAFEGRIARSKWWLGFLIVSTFVVSLMIFMALSVGAFVGQHPELEGKLSDPQWLNSPESLPLFRRLIPFMLPLPIAVWSLLALGVKRLHDRGLSSWLILVVVLPFLAVFVAPQLLASRITPLFLLASVIWGILQFGVLNGETGPNKHGPDPLAG